MRQARIGIIGVPLDLGAGRRGVDMGPSAIRVARLNQRLEDLGYEVSDLGNIAVEQPEASPVGRQQARYLAQIARTTKRLARQVERVLEEGRFPLVLGGDHSVAVGTVAGLARYLRRQHRRLGLIWIDAHADMNTPETSPSGNVHGMPLACCVGLGPRALTHLAGFAPLVEPQSVALVGVRDVDQLEKPHVRQSGVRAFTMRHIDERGVLAVIREAIAIAGEGTAGIHVSLDMDVRRSAGSAGRRHAGARRRTYREAHLVMEVLCDAGLLLSMEVVEVNPILDDFNRTAVLAVELIMSAMGKRIL
jgi:arginase